MTYYYQRRRGFTVVEMTVASGLTALLAVMLATTWVALGRPTSDLIAWGQLFQEMNIAVETISRDLGGSLPDYNNPGGPLGGKADGCLIMCQKCPNPPTNSAVDHLQLWFSTGTTTHANWLQPIPDGTVIDYYVDTNSHTIVRSNYTPPGANTPKSLAVASNVESMTVDPSSDGSTLKVTLNFQYIFPNNFYDHVTRTCTLIVPTFVPTGP